MKMGLQFFFEHASLHHLLRGSSKSLLKPHIIESVSYFHGFLTAEQSERLLKGKPPGSYIACNSTSEPSSCIELFFVDLPGNFANIKLYKHGSHNYNLTKGSVISSIAPGFSSLNEFVNSKPEIFQFPLPVCNDTGSGDNF